MGNTDSNKEEKVEVKVSEVKTYVMVVQLKLTQGRNKKVFDIKKKKEEVVKYLKDNNVEMAKLKAEGILRNEDHISAYDYLGVLCELIKEKITYMFMNDTCPDDLKAPLETMIFASTRLEIDEFHKFRELVQRKYGEVFILNANSNKSGLVNKNIEKQLSVLPFSERLLLFKLKEIAKDENIDVEFPEEIIIPIQDFSEPFVNNNFNNNFNNNNFNPENNFNNNYNPNFNNFDPSTNYPNMAIGNNYPTFTPQNNMNTNYNMNSNNNYNNMNMNQNFNNTPYNDNPKPQN